MAKRATRQELSAALIDLFLQLKCMEYKYQQLIDDEIEYRNKQYLKK